MQIPKITIGRIVHYKNQDGTVWPAMIVRVDDGDLDLRVFELDVTTSVHVEDRDMAVGPREAENGQWWWPERI